MSDQRGGEVVRLTAENIDAIDEAGPPYVVKFWAPWCGHCEAFAPIFDDAAAAHSDRLRFGEVNIDDDADIAEAHRVSTIPTVIVFRGGREVKRIVGSKTREVFVGELARFL